MSEACHYRTRRCAGSTVKCRGCRRTLCGACAGAVLRNGLCADCRSAAEPPPPPNDEVVVRDYDERKIRQTGDPI